jgi:hypothetical protein
MMVAAAFGTRLTTPAILSAVRSCRSRPSSEKLRRGKIAVTCVPGVSASWLTRSAAALVSLRSGQSMNSSDTLRSGSQAARSRSACSVSMTKCTARTVVGRMLFAYRSAAMVDRSKSSTKTMTTLRV